MSPEKSLQNLFNAALDRSDAAERARFLDEACGTDAALRERVEKLLRAQEEMGAFMAQPSRKPAGLDLIQAGRAVIPLTEKPGDKIGHYKLLQQIGEGGCGVVYMAEQEEPVRRRVAFKVIKLGMDTKQVIARFEAERQALALMEHPNIAKVLDAGATEAGRPYFVMELVRGVKITEFCDENKVATADRLKLFMLVCQAIQHAHQKGVVHRDIKPSNILVTINDGVPVPKVIDFGIAKATAGRLTDQTLFTAFEQFIGTPAYMSPEQAVMTSLDIDTRSDIYSLGVLLYELLTGRTPFDQKELLAAGLDAMRRTICEVEPVKPSTRLTQELAKVGKWESEKVGKATGPGTESHSPTFSPAHFQPGPRYDARKLQQLIPALRGDLDWIVMKCLEKDRARRYETANGLALDVQRHLNCEPVMARPPSRWYEFQKTVKRHKFGFAAAGLVLAALLAGMAGTTWGIIRAEQARQDAVSAQFAEANRAEGERRAKEEAQKRLAQNEKGTELLASVFRNLDPMTAEKEGLTSRDLLSRRLVEAAQQLEGEAVGDPLVVARLQHELGISLFELGHWEQAKEILVKASQTRERTLGADHLDTAATRHHLAMLNRELKEYPLAETLYQQALAVRTAKLGGEHLDTAATKHHLAMLYHSQDKQDLAEALLKEVLAVRTASLGADHADTLTTQHRLAMVYESQAKHALAETLHEEVLAIRTSRLGADHLDTIATKYSLANVHQSQGKFALAEALLKEVLAVRIAKLGAEHPDTLGSRDKLARLYHSQGKLALAEALYKKVLPFLTTKLGAEHPDTLSSREALAKLYRGQGNVALAEPLFKEVLAIQTAKLGAQHPDTLDSRYELATMYLWQGNFALAEPMFKEVLAVHIARLGASHPKTINTQEGLARLYLWQGNFALAEPLFKDVLAAHTARLGADHPATINSRDNLAMLYGSMKKLDQSIPLLEESFKLRKAQLEPDHPETLGRQVTLGANYCDSGRFAEGIALIEEVRQKRRTDPHPAWVRTVLLTAYVRAGQTTEATALVRERVRDARSQFPADSPEFAKVLIDNGKVLLDAKAYAAAEPLLLNGYEVRRQTVAHIQSQVEDLPLLNALERLVKLYDAWGKPDEAAKWRKEAKAARAADRPQKLKGP